MTSSLPLIILDSNRAIQYCVRSCHTLSGCKLISPKADPVSQPARRWIPPWRHLTCRNQGKLRRNTTGIRIASALVAPFATSRSLACRRLPHSLASKRLPHSYSVRPTCQSVAMRRERPPTMTADRRCAGRRRIPDTTELFSVLQLSAKELTS